MRLLVASIGDQPDDFAWTIPGEVIYLGDVCDRDADPNRDNGCGCGRAFAGLASRKATTTALVADLDLTRVQLVDMARDRWGDDAETVADELIALGGQYPVGTILGRHLDEVGPR